MNRVEDGIDRTQSASSDAAPIVTMQLTTSERDVALGVRSSLPKFGWWLLPALGLALVGIGIWMVADSKTIGVAFIAFAALELVWTFSYPTLMARTALRRNSSYRTSR